MKTTSKLYLVFIILLAQTTDIYAQYKYSFTKQQPVTDNYFGVRVTDNYRWMENMDAANVQQWFKQQAVFADSILDNIEGRDALLNDMITLNNIKTTTVSDIKIKHNRYFYRKMQSGENVSKIYYREGKNGKEILLVDVADFVKDNKGTIDYFVPSNDGKKLAFGVAESGAEVATIHIISVDNKKLYPETIYPSWDGVNAWTEDNKGFLYTLQQTGKTSDKNLGINSRVMYHSLGSDAATDKEILSGKKYPQLKIQPEDILFIQMEEDSRYMIAYLATVNPDRKTFIAPVKELFNDIINWKPLTTPKDAVQQIEMHGDKLYLLSHKNASRFQLLVTDAHKPDVAHAAIVVKETGKRIEVIANAKDVLYLQYTDGINNTLKAFDFVTKQPRNIPLPVSGSISLHAISTQSNDIIARVTSWKMPPALYDYDATRNRFSPSIFHTDANYPGVEDIVVEEIEVPGHDGVMIPLSIFYNKKAKLDGTTPCIMSGYGAYGFTYHPFFTPYLLAGVNKGLIAAWAHVRGGGEKGDDWHRAGYKQTKPNTWKDFISCAEYLIKNKYTSPQTLTGWGVSAGGILIGRAVTERPDLFTAAISDVSISNPLRFENTPNGPDNVAEFGTVKDSSEAMALIEMDALHHVRPGTKYPAVLCVGGVNDPRVIPWQPGKFAAALQSASSSEKPILMKVNYNSGHFTENRLITFKNFADAISFALWQSGRKDFQLKQSKK